MNNQSELISQFITMTQADEAQAQFFLEMSNWDLQASFLFFFLTLHAYNNRSKRLPYPNTLKVIVITIRNNKPNHPFRVRFNIKDLPVDLRKLSLY